MTLTLFNYVADTKSLPKFIKDLDPDSSKILDTFTFSNKSKERVSENALIAPSFFKSGGAYIEVNNLLNNYEVEIIPSFAKINSELAERQETSNSQLGVINKLAEFRKLYSRATLINSNDS